MFPRSRDRSEALRIHESSKPPRPASVPSMMERTSATAPFVTMISTQYVTVLTQTPARRPRAENKSPAAPGAASAGQRARSTAPLALDRVSKPTYSPCSQPARHHRGPAATSSRQAASNQPSFAGHSYIRRCMSCSRDSSWSSRGGSDRQADQDEAQSGRPGPRRRRLRFGEGGDLALRPHVGPGGRDRGVRHRPRDRQGSGRGDEDRAV